MWFEPLTYVPPYACDSIPLPPRIAADSANLSTVGINKSAP